MFKLRPLFWPTLFSLPVLLLCLGLGMWQMERRAWKMEILDRIAVNQGAAPVRLDELLKGDPLAREYGKAQVAGVFLHDKEFFLAARSRKNVVGMQIVTPLRTDDGRIVLETGADAAIPVPGMVETYNRRIAAARIIIMGAA